MQKVSRNAFRKWDTTVIHWFAGASGQLLSRTKPSSDNRRHAQLLNTGAVGVDGQVCWIVGNTDQKCFLSESLKIPHFKQSTRHCSLPKQGHVHLKYPPQLFDVILKGLPAQGWGFNKQNFVIVQDKGPFFHFYLKYRCWNVKVKFEWSHNGWRLFSPT